MDTPFEPRRLPQANPSDGHYLLHYNVHRPAFLGHTAATAEQFFRPFVAIMFLVMGAFIAYLGLVPLLAFIFLFAVPYILLDFCGPTNVEMSDRGIRIHWFHSLLFVSSPWFRWDTLRSVECADADVLSVLQGQCFDITIDTSHLSLVERITFELLCATVTTGYSKNQTTLRLLESGFFQESDRINFLNALRKYARPELLSADILARLEFGDVPTYTALWLEHFRDNDNDEDNSTAILPAGTMLAEGTYEVVSRLGSGGQGVLYAANRIANDTITSTTASTTIGAAEPCVLKEFVLPIRGGMEIKRRAVEHIQCEAALLKSFDDSHIVKFKDLFVEGPRAYLAMERINGISLRTLIERDGPTSSERAIELADAMFHVLEILHNQDPPVIHRDFTPENLMLTDDGRIVLIDFNVAHRLESTSTRTVVGKRAYVPPEQFRGKPTTQSDIYALGATLFFLLTGRDPEPITKSNPLTLAPNSNTLLSAAIECATNPDRNKRFATVREFRDALKSEL